MVISCKPHYTTSSFFGSSALVVFRIDPSSLNNAGSTAVSSYRSTVLRSMSHVRETDRKRRKRTSEEHTSFCLSDGMILCMSVNGAICTLVWAFQKLLHLLLFTSRYSAKVVICLPILIMLNLVQYQDQRVMILGCNCIAYLLNISHIPSKSGCTYSW